MDFLTGNVRSMYFRYLFAAFGSGLVTAVYTIVDAVIVGQYHGPLGTAAMAVIAPIWNIIFSLGLLMGIGGSVLFSTLRGKSADNLDQSNEYFTAAIMGASVLAAICWVIVVFFDRQLLTLLGAEETLLPLARSYLIPVKVVVPVYLFNQMLAAFLRNDGNPTLATAAIMTGGIFNIFGDYFFVFGLDLGIFGAGLATAIGSSITAVVMITHFLSKKNTLRLIRPAMLAQKLRSITLTGFSTFFTDVAMGIVTMLFNRQILKYLGTDALSVYGIIINTSTLVTCCAYSIGQAAQPIMSVNFGAQKGGRIRQALRCAVGTAIVLGVFSTAISVIAPNAFVRVFMTPTESIFMIAPAIIRAYSISFLLLPMNVFSTYYFQALLKPGTALIVSIARGAVISGSLIYMLPLMLGGNAIWFAMPITELAVLSYVMIKMRQYTKQLSL